ncbi:MAG: DUF2283 domain-containing protein [Chthoniobacterales bacterium]
MNIKYFEDTDTLYITLSSNPPVATEDLDENTLIDFDQRGNVCSLTIEHAQECIDHNEVHYERIERNCAIH